MDLERFVREQEHRELSEGKPITSEDYFARLALAYLAMGDSQDAQWALQRGPGGKRSEVLLQFAKAMTESQYKTVVQLLYAEVRPLGKDISQAEDLTEHLHRFVMRRYVTLFASSFQVMSVAGVADALGVKASVIESLFHEPASSPVLEGFGVDAEGKIVLPVPVKPEVVNANEITAIAMALQQ